MGERFEIVVTGTDSPMVRAAFDGFRIEDDDHEGRLVLNGEVTDQAALHGVLHRLQGLGLGIVDVHRTDLD